MPYRIPNECVRSVEPRRARLHAGLAAAACVALLCTAPAARAQASTSNAKTVAALKARIARLSTEAERLKDANEIRNLQRAYGYYLDKGYWHQAADLFADDGTLEVGVDGVYKGKAHILKYLILEGGGNPGPGLPYGQFNLHMVLQPKIDIAPDGKTAYGRWRLIAGLGHFHKDAEWETGIYENEYVKRHGVWMIAKLHFFPNFIAPYDKGWASLKPVKGDWKSPTGKAFPADAPPTVRYKPFPNVYTPPYHYKNPVTGR